jgi:hypothetical protein
MLEFMNPEQEREEDLQELETNEHWTREIHEHQRQESPSSTLGVYL